MATARWEARRLLRRVWAATLFGIWLTLLSPTAAADPSPADKETARGLMVEGNRLHQSGDRTAALRAYVAANEIMHVPTTALAAARAHAALGQLVEARDYALEAARFPEHPGEPEAFSRARTEAIDLAADLAQRIPAVRIRVQGVVRPEQVRMEVDGAALPPSSIGLARKLNPGSHRVSASAPGFERATETIVLEEGDNRAVSLVLERAPSSRPSRPVPAAVDPASRQRPRSGRSLTYVGLGIGGAGILVGSVSGGIALARASHLRSQCDGDACPPSTADEIDAGKRAGTVSDAGFAVGAAGTAVGLLALITGHRRAAKAEERRADPTATRRTPDAGGLPRTGADGVRNHRLVARVGVGYLEVMGWF